MSDYAPTPPRDGRPRRWLRVEFVVPLLIVTLAVYFEPNRIVRGWLAGESFFHGRPSSFWRKALRHAAAEGGAAVEGFRELGTERAAIPVLLACARDADTQVRVVAFSLLGKHQDFSGERAFSLYEAALRDESPLLRLMGLRFFADQGRLARPAVPVIVALCTDRDAEVARRAKATLLDVDADASVAEGAWRKFTSPEFGFSIMVPSEPEREKRVAPDGKTVTHFFRSRFGTCEYRFAVSNCGEEFDKATAEEDRVGVLRRNFLLDPTGEFAVQRSIEQLHQEAAGAVAGFTAVVPLYPQFCLTKLACLQSAINPFHPFMVPQALGAGSVDTRRLQFTPVDGIRPEMIMVGHRVEKSRWLPTHLFRQGRWLYQVEADDWPPYGWFSVEATDHFMNSFRFEAQAAPGP